MTGRRVTLDADKHYLSSHSTQVRPSLYLQSAVVMGSLPMQGKEMLLPAEGLGESGEFKLLK